MQHAFFFTYVFRLVSSITKKTPSLNHVIIFLDVAI